MEELGISMTGILVATLANFFVGFLWYTVLFGKTWAKEMGFDMSVKPAASVMMRGLLLNAIGCFLMAYVFAHNIAAWSFVPNMDQMSTVGKIMSSVVFTWLGFFVPVSLNAIAWESKSWKLFFINTSYHFMMLLASALILNYL
jgi:hypothetical protein